MKKIECLWTLPKRGNSWPGPKAETRNTRFYPSAMNIAFVRFYMRKKNACKNALFTSFYMRFYMFYRSNRKYALSAIRHF